MTLMLMVLGIGSILAQAPSLFNYQGVARDVKGAPLANKTLSLKLSILSAEDAIASDYQEIQTATTNEFGLYTLQVGGGTPLNGTLDKVNWESGNKYLQVAIDPKGGSKYEVVGTAQLLSVPYAIFASKAKVAGSGGGSRSGGVVTEAGTTGDNGYIPKFNGTPNTLTNSKIREMGSGRLGFGTASPDHDYSFYTPDAGNNIGNTVQIKSDNDNGFSRLRFKSSGTGNPSSELVFSKLGANATGTYMGLPRKNLTAVNSNGEPGDYVMVGTRNIVYGTFEGGNSNPVEKWRMTPDGKIGVGIKNPEARLEVNGIVDTFNKISQFMGVGIAAYDVTPGPIFSKVGMYSNINGGTNENIGLMTEVQGTAAVNTGVLSTVATNPGAGVSSAIIAADFVDASNTRALWVNGKSQFDGTAVMDTVMADHIATPSLAVDTLNAYRLYATELYAEGFNNRLKLIPGNTQGTFSMRNGSNNRMYIQYQNDSNTVNTDIMRMDTNSVMVGDDIVYLNNFSVHSFDDEDTTGITLEGGPGGNYQLYSMNLDATGKMHFLDETRLTSTSGTSTMTLDNDKVGINNINPEASLDVKGFKPAASVANKNVAIAAVDDQSSSVDNVGLATKVRGSSASNYGVLAEVENTTGSGIGILAEVKTAPASGQTMTAIEARENSGSPFAVALRTYGKTQFLAGSNSNQLVIQAFGRADFTRETTIDTLISDTISATSTTTANLQVTGGTPGNGKVLTSDAAGNATWKANSAGQAIVNPTITAIPNGTLGDAKMLHSDIVTITSSTQKVYWTTTVQLGSTASGGADKLRIYPGWQFSVQTGQPVVATTGQGYYFELKCAPNTRQTYTVSGYRTGLNPGTYKFGMGAYAYGGGNVNWNDNGSGHTRVMVTE